MSKAKLPAALTAQEISSAFGGPWAERFPPILTIRHVADLFHVTLKTAYGWSSDGRLDDAKFKAGKHVFFLRDRVPDVMLANYRTRNRKPK